MTEPPVLMLDHGVDDQTVYALFEQGIMTEQWVLATRWVSVSEAMKLPIQQIEHFRFIESPLLPEKDNMPHYVHSRSKKGRQLNSKKTRWGGASHYGKSGEKELERGVRCYMSTHYPPIYNRQTGEWQAPVKRPGVGTLCVMSKKQFDRDVTYIEGEENVTA